MCSALVKSDPRSGLCLRNLGNIAQIIEGADMNVELSRAKLL